MVCPLIGLEAEVVSSSSKELLGVNGKIIDETKNMVVFENKNKIKKIRKKGNVFEISFEGKKIRIIGDKIMFRPEEKAKNIKIHW